MRFEALSLRNFRQHSKLDLELGPGMFAVLAPNGGGKSNLVSALHFALAGSPLDDGGLDTLCTWGASSGSVSLSCSTPSGSLEVVRTYKSGPGGKWAGSHLASHAGIKSRKESEVAELLAALMGVDPSGLREVAFAAQGEVASLLTAPPARRRQAVLEMLGLARVERLRGACTKAAATVVLMEAPPPDRARTALDAALADLACVRGGIAAAAEAFEALSASSGRDEILAASAAKEDMEAEVAELKSRLTAAEASLSSIGRGAFPMAAHATALKADKARERLAAMAASRSALSRTALAAFAARPLKSSQPPPPDMEALLAAHAAAAHSVEVARSKLKLADAGRCWVCGSATVSDVQAARAELTSALSSMESLNVKVKDAKMLSQAAAEWLAWRSRRGKARLMAVRDRRLEAELLSSAAGCLAPEARSILASGTPSEHLEASRKSTVALVASLRDSLARSAPASLPSRSEVLAARSAVKALAAAGARLEALTAEALKVEAAVRVRESELTEALRLDAIAAARSRKRSLLKGASDLLSGENLQRALAARMSLLVNSALKANLEELGASFEVSLEPSLDFSVRVNGNKAGPMALSGGQRCLAGIALRLAAFTASGAGCGVLVLDEPTAFLDTRARTALRESLPRLSRSILKSGICLLIPTHDPELADVCGEVVNL